MDCRTSFRSLLRLHPRFSQRSQKCAVLTVRKRFKLPASSRRGKSGCGPPLWPSRSVFATTQRCRMAVCTNLEMLNKLTLLLVATLFAVGCHVSATSQANEIASGLARVTINPSSGNKTPIPHSSGLTIVNLFDQFSPGWPTGNHFETIERFNSMRPAGSAVLFIFSEKNFSTQDVENFQAILPMPESMVQGDIEALRPYLINGKLLVVLDSNGRLVWQEKANVSEEQLLSELGNLVNAPNK